MRRENVYRGNAISLAANAQRELVIEFHPRQKIERDAVILPSQLLAKVERHTLAFTAQAEAMRKSGRHLRRGLLLYGPPGTGKTLLVKHLLSRMEGRTSIIVTGA